MLYTDTVGYYAAIKDKTMLFTAPWMDLEITMLSEVSQRQISYDITDAESKMQPK